MAPWQWGLSATHAFRANPLLQPGSPWQPRAHITQARGHSRRHLVLQKKSVPSKGPERCVHPCRHIFLVTLHTFSLLATCTWSQFGIPKKPCYLETWFLFPNLWLFKQPTSFPCWVSIWLHWNLKQPGSIWNHFILVLLRGEKKERERDRMEWVGWRWGGSSHRSRRGILLVMEAVCPAHRTLRSKSILWAFVTRSLQHQQLGRVTATWWRMTFPHL